MQIKNYIPAYTTAGSSEETQLRSSVKGQSHGSSESISTISLISRPRACTQLRFSNKATTQFINPPLTSLVTKTIYFLYFLFQLWESLNEWWMNQGNGVKELSIEFRGEGLLGGQILDGVEKELLTGVDFVENQLTALLQ